MRHLSRSHFLSSLLEGSALLAIFSIPLGTRALFGFVTPGFDEYEAFFLYASDIAVLLFLALLFVKENDWLRRIVGALPRVVWQGGALFFLAALLSLAFAPSFSLALYAFVRLALGGLFALGLAAAIGRKFVTVPFLFGSLAAAGVSQALLAFWQFKVQGSVGLALTLPLTLLGEPLLGPLVGGAAKIMVAGGALLRSYGTLPHSNILAAVLIVAFIALSYFWLNRRAQWRIWSGGKSLWSDILIGVLLYVIALGLTLTFSRSGWLAALAAAAFLAASAFLIKELRIQAARFVVLLFTISFLLFSILGWAIFPRVTLTSEEPAVAYRLRYNELAIELIKKNPLGVGIGNQVLYGVTHGVYFDLGMTERWQWQPVHNLHLLIASEIGLLGLLGFLAVALGALWYAARGFIKARDGRLELCVAAVAFAALLLLGFFDHYLWTLQAGRLLLWGAFGILLGSTLRSRARSSTDRIHPSEG